MLNVTPCLWPQADAGGSCGFDRLVSFKLDWDAWLATWLPDTTYLLRLLTLCTRNFLTLWIVPNADRIGFIRRKSPVSSVCGHMRFDHASV